MKKILSLLFVVLMLLPSLVSCHGSEYMPEFSMPREFDTSRDYEIVFWAKSDTKIVQTRIYEKAIADFEALYPNIKVTFRQYTDYSKIYNDVITNIATNTTPNVCITYPDHIATYMTGENTVVPLEKLINDKNYGLGGEKVLFDSPSKDEIIEKFLNECKIGDELYALPYMRSSEACYINKTYVERLGYTIPDVLTWDFIWEVSDAATAKNEDGTYKLNGQKVLIPFIYKSTDNMMIQMLRQKNAPFSNDEGEILMFNDDAREILYTIKDHVGKGAFSTFSISSYPGNYFNVCQCIFAIDSTAGATWIGLNAPLSDVSRDNVEPFETVVRPIPQFDTENPQMISQGPSMCLFNKKDPQEVLAAWLFMQYMLTNDVQIAYSQTEGYVPVTEKALNSNEYKDYLSREGENNDEYYDIKIKASKLILDNIDNTFITSVFNGSASVRNAAGQLIEEVAKSTRRHKTVDDEYIDKLYEDMVSLYHLDSYGTSLSEKVVFGEFPKEASMLIYALAGSWVLIIVFFIVKKVKKSK